MVGLVSEVMLIPVIYKIAGISKQGLVGKTVFMLGKKKL